MEAKFSVEGELGLHARPAGRFVTLAGRFESEIWVARAGADSRAVAEQCAASALARRIDGDDGERVAARAQAAHEAGEEGDIWATVEDKTHTLESLKTYIINSTIPYNSKRTVARERP